MKEESKFDFDTDKRYGQKKKKKAKECNLKIWIKKTLSLSKARGVIAENILLLKYQTHVITPALNGTDSLILLAIALRKLWI